MLNISKDKLNQIVDLGEYKSGKAVFYKKHHKLFNRFLVGISLLFILILFLPWTQNISSSGYVTTLQPEHRPQTVQSPIPGRIEKWYVQEGDFVQEGDTILHISEVKSEYFDPELIGRTSQQILAKSNSAESYNQKIAALNSQLVALRNERELKEQQAANKLRQAGLKVQSDSIDLEAAKTNLSIAETQFERTRQLQEEGLKAMTDVEEKRLKLQETQAKLISAENKLLTSQNEVINAQIEISRIEAEYADKLSKTQGEISTAQSNRFNAEGEVSKLQVNLSNYERRRDLYYVRAPQSGYINKALRAGIGETFKEGDRLVGIMPADFQLAVETFVKPLDIPLLHLGEEVRVQFDGWPSIVFSGWPNLSYGTYGAKVVAIENYISENGKYRILLAPDPNDQPWPQEIGIGSGATTIALLEEVPIWYELWRNLNGFPPDYYQPQSKPTTTQEKK